MADSNKRKDRGNHDRDARGPKRSKGGSGGKWQTPHQKARAELPRTRAEIEPGDAGIWVTCARNQERRAAAEIKSMFEECAERFYGIVSNTDTQESEDGDGDIEASIRKEVASMENGKLSPQVFTLVHLDLPCVLFFKTGRGIEPVDFVHRICEEIVAKPGTRRMRYVNRLTPMALMGKATEKGLEEVTKSVLSYHFVLNDNESNDGGTAEKGTSNGGNLQGFSTSSYAIRPTIRNHSTLKRDGIIKEVASFISDSHKVDLTTPQKVILIEVYQKVCGVSVVGSDWEKLKRFNLAELYPKESSQKAQPPLEDAAGRSLLGRVLKQNR